MDGIDNKPHSLNGFKGKVFLDLWPFLDRIVLLRIPYYLKKQLSCLSAPVFRLIIVNELFSGTGEK